MSAYGTNQVGVAQVPTSRSPETMNECLNALTDQVSRARGVLEHTREFADRLCGAAPTQAGSDPKISAVPSGYVNQVSQQITWLDGILNETLDEQGRIARALSGN